MKNLQLFPSDYVVYNPQTNDLSRFCDGEIVIYGDKSDALQNCADGIAIRCTELPTHFQDALISQLKNNL